MNAHVLADTFVLTRTFKMNILFTKIHYINCSYEHTYKPDINIFLKRHNATRKLHDRVTKQDVTKLYCMSITRGFCFKCFP